MRIRLGRVRISETVSEIRYEVPPASFWLVTSAIFAVHAVLAVVVGSAALFGVLCSITAILATLTYFLRSQSHASARRIGGSEVPVREFSRAAGDDAAT